MKQALSILTVLIAVLELGVPDLRGGGNGGAGLVSPSEHKPGVRDANRSKPAGPLAAERLAKLQAPARSGGKAEPGGGGNSAVNVPGMRDTEAAGASMQEPAASATAESKSEAEAPASPAIPPRDPTEPGEELRDMVAPFRMGQPGRPGSAAGLAAPRVVLKGRIIGPSAPPAAIVELQGAMYVVHEESELTIDGPEAAIGGLTLRVNQITFSEVRIEILPLRKVMVLR